MAVPRPARDPQNARYRAPARTEDRTDQQGLSVSPRPVDEQRSERQDDPGEAGGQVRHEASLARDTISLSITPASSPSAFRDMSKWPKSSSAPIVLGRVLGRLSIVHRSYRASGRRLAAAGHVLGGG